MQYLSSEALYALDAKEFRNRKPYPWCNPADLLHPEAYRQLLQDLPPVETFDKTFGKVRKFGQHHHDRYSLEYRPDLALSDSWRGFIDELQGPVYREWLAGMMNSNAFSLSFHWHYTPNGCSVSPHCDARRKLGSHIFYFNTTDDWDPAWGGDTVVLDDGGRFSRRSAPAFEDFDRAESSVALGNRSLLFVRNGNSWHGVREIRCPPDALRKVFIVVIDQMSIAARLRRLVAA